MKTSTVGIMSMAILLVVTGVGFGITQSEGTYADRPVLSFENQELPQAAKSLAEDMQFENPIETGSLPAESNAESSMVKVEGNTMYQAGVDTDDP